MLGAATLGVVGLPRLPMFLRHSRFGPLGVQLYTLRSLMAQSVERSGRFARENRLRG